MGMLAPALRRHIGHSALQNLQQRLLDTFAGYISGDGGVLTLAGDLINFVYINDAPLGQLNVIVGRLHQAQQNVLHVIAHITRLGKGGGVGNGKGHLQDPGQGLGKQGFTAASGSNHEDIGLLQLHIIPTAEINALIMIVYRHRQGHLGAVLTDDILIQHRNHLFWGRNHVRDIRRSGGIVLFIP